MRHHNIILGPRYEELLRDIFDRKVLSEDFSHYLHVPTLTDPSLAPPGHHAAYTLVPVPNKTGEGAKIDWSKVGPELADRALQFLDERGYIPGLCQRLVHKSFISPDYFERALNSYAGNAFRPRAAPYADCLLPPAQPQRGHRASLSRGRKLPTWRRHAQRDDERQDDRALDRQGLWYPLAG